MITHPRITRGFTLLIAVVMTSVILSVGLALLDIAYKQVVLSSVARQSQYAFYAADSAMECALYWDQKFNAFAFDDSQYSPTNTITCGNTTLTLSTSKSGATRTTTFNTACQNGVTGSVRVVKSHTSACSGLSTNCIYASGFNTCNADDARRIERALKATY